MNQEPKSNIPFTDRPDFEQEIDRLLNTGGLSVEDTFMLWDYQEDGYLIIDTEIEDYQCNSIIYGLSGEYPDIKNPRIANAWESNEAVRKLATNERIMRVLRLLYQREPIPFQTLNFPVGTEQRTHSDMVHFNSIPQRFMCGVWVALEDVTDLNGPLHYYPGSHNLPFYDMLDMGIKGSDNRHFKKEMMNYTKKYEVYIQMVIDSLGLKKQTLNIKKGQAIIWSANLLHGGDPIVTPNSTRHSQVTHYFFEDCLYYTPYFSDLAINKLFLLDLKNIITGKKVKNKYFDQTLSQSMDQSIKESAIKMLSHVSHLFPVHIVKKVKEMLGR